MTDCCIEGIALWTAAWPGWAHAAPALCVSAGDARVAPQPLSAARPTPTLLAANERRRAPDTVLVALEVAGQALADAGASHSFAAADGASVFVSCHGDLGVTDALCSTLAHNPLLLSPTRFHHSVHNAASGYWAIASGSRGPSTALSAQETSFAAAWLEASGQCQTDQRPVLLVAYDTGACGGLLSVNSSRGLLGLALLLAPAPGPRSRWRVQTAVLPGAAPALTARSPVARALADNAMAPALPLFEALAAGLATQLALPLSVGTKLQLMLQLMLQPQAENRHFEPP